MDEEGADDRWQGALPLLAVPGKGILCGTQNPFSLGNPRSLDRAVHGHAVRQGDVRGAGIR